MTTIIMGILLVSFVSAYTYLPTSDERYVTSTHTFSNAEEETYKFQSHLDYCDLNCSKTEWQAYVDKDLNRYITDKEFDIANPNKTQEIIISNYSLLELLEKQNVIIKLLEDRISTLEAMLNISIEPEQTSMFICETKGAEECPGGLSAENKAGFNTRCYNPFKIGWTTCSTGWKSTITSKI